MFAYTGFCVGYSESCVGCTSFCVDYTDSWIALTAVGTMSQVWPDFYFDEFLLLVKWNVGCKCMLFCIVGHKIYFVENM